jgi:nitrogen fixation protein FixH
MAPVTAAASGKLQGRHVLMLFVAFFGAIFAVNGYFLYAALATHTGVVSQEPYRKGLAYNDRIAADERQSALGWQHTIDLALDGHVRLRMTDAAGHPVAGLRFEATVGRPVTGDFDRRLALAETAPGVYEGRVAALTSGAWIAGLEAFATSGQEPIYRGRNRLWLKP